MTAAFLSAFYTPHQFRTENGRRICTYQVIKPNFIMASTFTHKKRIFLLSKLDETIKLWACGSGQGSFTFSVKNGKPSLQCDLHLEMLDVAGSVPVQPQYHHQQPPTPHRPRRRRGPARQARDRKRAAEHQDAMAAAAEQASTFPGKEKAVVPAVKPSPPVLLSTREAVTNRVSLLPSASTVVTSVPGLSSRVSTFTNSRSLATHVVAPAMYVRDEFVNDDSEDEDLPCSRCLKPFDDRSCPLGCGHCRSVFHTKCEPGHKCLSFVS